MTEPGSRGRSLRPAWLRWAGEAGLAVALTLLVMIVTAPSSVDRADLAVLRGVRHQAVTHHWLVTAADAFSAALGPTPIRAAVAVALLVVLVRAPRGGRVGLVRRSPIVNLTAAAVLGGAVLAPTVKMLVGRPRPPESLRLGSAGGNSYPSGHAVSITIAAMVAILLTLGAAGWVRATVAVVAVTLAVLVCAARVVLAVHYPSDVLGGAGFGLAWTAGSWWLAQRYGRPSAESVAPELGPDAVSGTTGGTRAAAPSATTPPAGTSPVWCTPV
ncbi:MAG: phosphatase PAP2 family protein [bacterium]